MSVGPIFVFMIGPYFYSLFPSGVAIATSASTCSGSEKLPSSFTPDLHCTARLRRQQDSHGIIVLTRGLWEVWSGRTGTWT